MKLSFLDQLVNETNHFADKRISNHAQAQRGGADSSIS